MKSALKSNNKSPFIQRESSAAQHVVRLRIVLIVLLLAAVGLLVRAVDLQLMDHGFLADQGEARSTRVLQITAHRGTITDRYGEPLAVSTPVDSVWANPKELSQAADQLPKLARALGRDREGLARLISSNVGREFVYLKRHLQPYQAERIKALGIPGVHLLREYRRYYPAGEVTGHILGFTDIDDAGQEGLELAYDHWLTGENGSKRVIQDRLGRVVENVESIREARPGKDLVLSLDLRIQYLAYRELKRAMSEEHAKAGSVVVLDVQTGEVLAMVNQPVFNPNDRDQRAPARYRNRAATDIFEPGSIMKPFVMAAALASGRYRPDSVVDTAEVLRYGPYTTKDEHPIGIADMSTVLARSSNVGMAKIALDLNREQMWKVLDGMGFGQVTTSGFPGESAGLLNHYSHWRPVNITSMSRGYGLSVTPLQLAHAYAVLAADGVSRSVTFLRPDGVTDAYGVRKVDLQNEDTAGRRVLDAAVARSLVHMLESVVTLEGATGKRAAVPGYRVAGKTGTAYMAIPGGYSQDIFRATFGGVAPASRPRLACIAMLDALSGKEHQGGQVAAPVFSGVMAGALRLMAIAPDDIPVQEEPSASVTVASAMTPAEVRP